MLDKLERSVLVAIDRLTRDDYSDAEGEDIAMELARMGCDPGSAALYNVVWRLRDEGYVDARFAGGMTIAFVRLTEYGRDQAREVDPFERVRDEARNVLASRLFADRYPGAFEAWVAAERLLWEEDTPSNLTTIGHNVRDATQRFTTTLVEEHRPPTVAVDQALVEKRLGAVIAMHRNRLGVARRQVLEALGDLWEANNRLIQRQVHGASKEDEPVTWDDARRIVYLTMFLMVEFFASFEDLPPTRPTHPEGG
jgi:DNA-binding PadR family transcriptional regulator